jgi:photosystem II stability/assembly factor-like uncharacterized protein
MICGSTGSTGDRTTKAGIMTVFRPFIAALLVAFVAPSASGQEGEEVVAYRLYAATSNGPFESHNWGEEWFPISEVLAREIRVFSCIGPQAFAGGAGGLFFTDDFGTTWNQVEAWDGGEILTILPAAYFVAEPVVFVGTREGLYRSRDGGKQWERVGAGTVEATVHDIGWPGPGLWLATSQGLFRTEDGGASWSSDSPGLPEAPLLSLALSRFFGQDPVAFVGTDGEGLFRSRDGGESFHFLHLPARRVYSLYWWRASLFAGTEDGLYISQDAGESWEAASTELKGLRVHSVWVPAPDSGGASDILLGTDRGVYKSSDGGMNWQFVVRGMRSAVVFGFGNFPIHAPDESQRKRE